MFMCLIEHFGCSIRRRVGNRGHLLLLAPLRAAPLFHFPPTISSPRTPSLPGDRRSAFDWAKRGKPRHRGTETGRMSTIYQPQIKSCRWLTGSSAPEADGDATSQERCPNNGPARAERSCKQSRVFLFNKCSSSSIMILSVFLQEKLPVPRSSSPVSVYIDFPCIIDQGSLRTFGLISDALQSLHTGAVLQLFQQLHGRI